MREKCKEIPWNAFLSFYYNDVTKKKQEASIMSILEVKSLKKVYTTRFGANQVTALRDVNFSVEKGEYVAIKGFSGYRKCIANTGNLHNVDMECFFYLAFFLWGSKGTGKQGHNFPPLFLR